MREFLRGSLVFCATFVLTASCLRRPGDMSDVKFYGADSQSSTISFETYVYVERSDNTTPKEMLTGQHLGKVRRAIDRQLQHIYGAFTEHKKYVDNPGIIDGHGDTTILDATAVSGGKFVKVTYSYKDKAVFAKALMKDDDHRIKFVLPRDPVGIYKKTLGADGVNHCTDEHYNTEGDFWYFWNPGNPGCPIRDSDLVEVTARLDPIVSTKSTYPDYDTLYGDNGNGKTFQVVYLVGVDENFRNGDLGRGTYEDALKALVERGFKIKEQTPRTAVLTRKNAQVNAEVDMRLISPGSNVFVETAAKGLENADVFIYDGHSGLGGYLSRDRFEYTLGRSLKLPLSKSQIFYFNGCSTYSYYNADYFALKKTSDDPTGTKNLDIVTTSIGAAFAIGAGHDSTLIDGLTSGERPSWQTLMKRIYHIDPELTALTHVNGDEDNPRDGNG